MYKTKAYSAASATSPLAHTSIPRREPTEHDVQLEILFCGICHSDLHSVRNEWSEFAPTVYPIVPGHEIVGRVANVGSRATKFKPGDLAAAGCLVDSDRTCPACKAGLENFCPHLTLTFNSPDQHKTAPVTYGGYSDSIVVDEHFALRVPSNDINAYINLLGRDGNLTLVGAPAKPLGVSAFPLIVGRRSLSGSNIGGIPETPEMLDFCGQHNITAEVEVIPIQKVNEAYDRMARSDVKYRFSIDMASLKAE
jgi:D-arabinose 1-dehydrogenase-like Zn-dependent alcohol dehydrogenase